MTRHPPTVRQTPPASQRTTARLAVARLAVVCLILALLLLTSGCAALTRWEDRLKASVDHWTGQLTSLSEQVSSMASSAASDLTTLSESAETSEPDSETSLPTLDAAFSRKVSQLIIAGLDQFASDVVLDSALKGYQISKEQSQAVIDEVYAIYEQVYRQNPQYFWLDGSARLSYSYQTGKKSRLSAMSLKLGCLETYARSSPAALADRQQDLFTEVTRLANQARKKTEPWQQLRAIHDTLVRSIVYDQDLNQQHNNAASALLDHLSMCQGYAQAFLMIAEELGFQVRLISGQASAIDHAWNLVWLDGQPYHVDVTHDDPVPDGGKTDHPDHVHFLRSDAVMRESHHWIARDYPACPQDGAFYYRELDLMAASLDQLKSRIDGFVSAADLGDEQSDQLEILYTGAERPSRKAVEKLIIHALSARNIARSMSYRLDISKQVVLIELMPPD